MLPDTHIGQPILADMAGKIIGFVKAWSLPLGILAGIAVYAVFHFVPQLEPLKPAATSFAGRCIPVLLFVMLFLTFCKIAPKDLKVRRWHLWLAAIQIVSCVAIAVPLHFFPDFAYAEIAEGAMVCLVCPTAAAAAVITGKLGGSESSLTTYTIVSNIVAAVVIPVVFPLVETHADMSLPMQFVMILKKVFPLLIFPMIGAWLVRYLLPAVHAFILRHCGELAFYLWSFTMIMLIGQTIRAIVNSDVDAHVKWLLAVAGLVVCVLQFAAGKAIGGHYGDRISGGQGLGQKNTVFAIWVSGAYLSPVVAIAPGSYILWQNLINSWQIWRKQKRDAENA